MLKKIVKRLAFANQTALNSGRKSMVNSMTLKDAEEGKEYVIREIKTDDEEMNAFLFSLGCYAGEKITVVAHRRGGCTVSIKDGRYNIDSQLADAIAV